MSRWDTLNISKRIKFRPVSSFVWTGRIWYGQCIPLTFTFRIHLHDFLFNLVGSCLSLFDDFRLEIAVSVAWHCDFALAIVADYRLFPVTNSACCPMLCGVHAALWGQLRKHPVCGCYRSYSRLRSFSRSRDVRPFLLRASALSSRQTAFSVLPECLRWLRPTSWSDSLPSAVSQVPSLDHLIRVFFSCAIPHFLWVLLAFTRFGIQTLWFLAKIIKHNILVRHGVAPILCTVLTLSLIFFINQTWTKEIHSEPLAMSLVLNKSTPNKYSVQDDSSYTGNSLMAEHFS